MNDSPKDQKPEYEDHGVWFWKLAIFEGTSSTFVVMGTAILAASATLGFSYFSKNGGVAMVVVLARHRSFRSQELAIVHEQNSFIFDRKGEAGR